MKKSEYTKEEVSVMQKISKEVLNDLTLEANAKSFDIMYNTITMRLSGYIYSRTSEERKLEYYFDRPSFLDWALRRKRKAIFNLIVKDLALKKPEENTLRTYSITAL